jgi:non-specific serine/threonine protein kinase
VLLHNLPLQPTSFIGREQVMAQIKQLLATTQLLTLTGVGGTGKTRLALQIAAPKGFQNPSGLAFPDGVWFIELAPLADPSLVPQTVASVLGVREEQGRPITATLVDWLRAKSLLLLLDNCEHLIDACAQFADTMLHACPDVKILATSREALGIAGEQTFQVPSLQLPTPNSQLPTAELAQLESVQLFVERAQAVQSHFQLTEANAAAVVQICQRLDGIPLALELAAARVKALSVEQIAARLDDRFRLLTGGSRTAVPRQQTLRAAIDWSYSLLTAPECTLLLRLSVFAGGWTLEAAEAVCSRQSSVTSSQPHLTTDDWLLATDEVLDLLTQLVNKSLVITEEFEGQTRYRMLETVRQYAREKLLASGESEPVRERHLTFFVQFAEAAESKLEGPEQAIWFNRLEVEYDNIRAALDWALHSSDAVAGLRLAAALWSFWFSRGPVSEGRERLTAALAHVGAEAQTVARARGLIAVGRLAFRQGDLALARSYSEEGLSISRDVGDRRGMALSLRLLGNMFRMHGDYATAQAHLEESLSIGRTLGDKATTVVSLLGLGSVAESQGDYAAAHSWYAQGLTRAREFGDKIQIARTLSRLGSLFLAEGDYATAQQLGEEGLALQRATGDKNVRAVLLQFMAAVAVQQGDPARAEMLARESLVLAKELEDIPNLAACLMTLASVRAARGHLERATRLCGAIQAFLEARGSQYRWPVNQREQEHTLATVRMQFSEADFNAAWEAGRRMTLDEAVALALTEPTEIPTPKPQIPTAKQDFGGLTAREREVASLVAQGMSNREIAESLVIGERTVESHVSSIFNKLGFTRRAEVRRWVKEQGLD